jgi:AraC family transcriptional activator of pobA
MITTFSASQTANLQDQLSFEINTLEWSEQNRDLQLAQRHVQSQVELIWIKEGAGLHVVDQQQFPLINHTVYCVAPGQQHQLIIHPGSTGYIISFKAAFLHAGINDNELQEASFFQRFSRLPGVLVEEEAGREMQEVVEKLLKEMDNYFLLRTEILNRYLKILLIYLRRQFEAACPGAVPEINNKLLTSFFQLVEAKYMEIKTVAAYAQELFVTPNHLNAVIKKLSGYPASYHIRQRIIKEAKRRAQQTGDTMKETAYYLGFDDIAHFSKFFKNSSGMNFTDYRRTAVQS